MLPLARITWAKRWERSLLTPFRLLLGWENDLPLTMATLHIYSTRYGVQTIHVFGCIYLETIGTHSYALPTLDLPAHAIHGGARGSIYFNCYTDKYWVKMLNATAFKAKDRCYPGIKATNLRVFAIESPNGSVYQRKPRNKGSPLWRTKSPLSMARIFVFSFRSGTLYTWALCC